VGATPHRGAASRAGERLRASPEMVRAELALLPALSGSWPPRQMRGVGAPGARAHSDGSTRTKHSCDIEQIGQRIPCVFLMTGFVEDWISTQPRARTRSVPYKHEVEVSDELGGRLARTFSSVDEHGQFFDHRNGCISSHTALLSLLKAGFVNKSAAPNSSIRESRKRQKFWLPLIAAQGLNPGRRSDLILADVTIRGSEP
jgi:hypothetical protein